MTEYKTDYDSWEKSFAQYVKDCWRKDERLIDVRLRNHLLMAAETMRRCKAYEEALMKYAKHQGQMAVRYGEGNGTKGAMSVNEWAQEALEKEYS